MQLLWLHSLAWNGDEECVEWAKWGRRESVLFVFPLIRLSRHVRKLHQLCHFQSIIAGERTQPISWRFRGINMSRLNSNFDMCALTACEYMLSD